MNTTKKKRAWCGVKVGHEAIHVGRIPQRKRIALYYAAGNEIRPLAYFRREKDARLVEQMLLKIAGLDQ